MKASSRLLALLLLLIAPMVLVAQDEMPEAPEPPGFLMFNQNQVPGGDMAALNQNVDSLMRPVLDAMVDEGIINNWGIVTHNWGDEWNWNWYMFTKDHATFVSAWSEFVNRLQAADSTAFAAIYRYVTEHKDNTYGVRHFKGRELMEDEAPPKFMMLNQHKVRPMDLGAANALTDSTFAMVLDAMVDDGTLYFWGQINHSWGDEWNYNYYIGAENHADFVSAWGEFVERLQTNHPDALGEFQKLSKSHKDNLYFIRYAK